jgi:hypothetical protein
MKSQNITPSPNLIVVAISSPHPKSDFEVEYVQMTSLIAGQLARRDRFAAVHHRTLC